MLSAACPAVLLWKSPLLNRYMIPLKTGKHAVQMVNLPGMRKLPKNQGNPN